MFGSKNRRIADLTYDNRCLGESLDGEIARVRDRDKTIGALRTEVESVREASYGADRTAAMYKRLYEGACKTLGNIAGQETTTANATVKRMARMARSELPMQHHEQEAPTKPTPTNGAAAQAVV